MSNFPPYRSVYLPPIRDDMPELIDLFDGSDPDAVTGNRQNSNGAEQSLFLLNSPFILEQAEHFAETLREQSDDLGAQVRFAFLQAFGRPPSHSELESASHFYKAFVSSDKDSEQRFLTLFCQGLLASAEFRYLN